MTPIFVKFPSKTVVSKPIKPATDLYEKVSASTKKITFTILIEFDDFITQHLDYFY
jgi:hypothetical protein